MLQKLKNRLGENICKTYPIKDLISINNSHNSKYKERKTIKISKRF